MIFKSFYYALLWVCFQGALLLTSGGRGKGDIDALTWRRRERHPLLKGVRHTAAGGVKEMGEATQPWLS